MEGKFFLTDELLWDYADGFLDATEKVRVEQFLEQHPEWQQRLRLIRDEKQSLAAMSLEDPGVGFTDRVMAAWAAEQATAKAKNGKDWIIRLIPVVFVAFVLYPLIVMVSATNKLAPKDLPSVSLPELPAVDWASWISSPILLYGLLLLTAVFGLRFLDKILQHQRLAHKLT